MPLRSCCLALKAYGDMPEAPNTQQFDHDARKWRKYRHSLRQEVLGWHPTSGQQFLASEIVNCEGVGRLLGRYPTLEIDANRGFAAVCVAWRVKCWVLGLAGYFADVSPSIIP